MRHLLHVDAARGDVGRHQNRRAAGLELGERALALALPLVAVDGVGRDAVRLQRLHDLVGAVLGAGEDERAAHALAAQDFREQRALAVVLDQDGALADLLGGACHRRHLDPHRVLQHLAREVGDHRRHGRREEHGLPRALGGDVADDAPHVRQKAAVEHLVSLVEDEDLRVVEPRVAGVHVVEQPARRRDQHVHPPRQRLLLRAGADAAEHDGDGKAHVLAVFLEAVGDLARQFAGGREDEHAAAAARRMAALGPQLLQDGQREGRGLACAGLGDAEHVTAAHRVRDGLSLDGGGGVVAGLGEGTEQFGLEAEGFERGGHGGVVAIHWARARRLWPRGHVPRVRTPRVAGTVQGNSQQGRQFVAHTGTALLRPGTRRRSRGLPR